MITLSPIARSYSVLFLLFLFYFRTFSTILTGTAQKFNQTVAASQAQKEYVENLGKQSNIFTSPGERVIKILSFSNFLVLGIV